MIRICSRPACGISYPIGSHEYEEGFCICGAPLVAYRDGATAAEGAPPAVPSSCRHTPHPRCAIVPPAATPAAPAPGPTMAPSVDRGALALISRHGEMLLRFPLDRDEVWIGRPSQRRGPVDIDCSCWPEYGISRRHCLVLRAAQGWQVQRGAEARAVWWNGRLLAPGERAPLQPGDEVVLGDGLGLMLVAHTGG